MHLHGDRRALEPSRRRRIGGHRDRVPARRQRFGEGDHRLAIATPCGAQQHEDASIAHAAILRGLHDLSLGVGSGSAACGCSSAPR